VDFLVFVSRHLSEGNFDIYIFAALLERENKTVDSDAYWFPDYSTDVF